MTKPPSLFSFSSPGPDIALVLAIVVVQKKVNHFPDFWPRVAGGEGSES